MERNNPPTAKNLTIIIPAYNEAGAIKPVLESIATSCGSIVHTVIVVDDGSTDETSAVASSVPGVKVIRHFSNRGYGAAIKSGLRATVTDYALTMDSDGQHQAEDALRLYEASGDSDMVIGQRTELLHSPLWRMPGKWLLGWMANYLTRQTIPDLNSGMRVMRRKAAMRYMHLCPSGFSFSTTMTMALLMRGYNVKFVPITVRKRIGKSTVSLKTGFDTIMLIIRIAALFDPLRVFIPLSMAATLIGLFWEIPFAVLGRGVSIGSMLAIVTGILMFALGVICDQISQMRLERYEGID